jgi:hypothetical protein
MNERDPLIDAIRAAGEVPPPPDRDAAFARAMHPVLMPSRRRLSRSFIALFAAALLAAPAAVFAAHVTHTPAAVETPIVSERPDPGSSIHSEADDTTLNREQENEHEVQRPVVTSSSDEHTAVSSGTDDHSGSDSTSGGSDGTSNSGSGSGDHPTLSPTPTESSSSGSSGDGGTSSDGGSSISGSTDGGTSGSN